MALSFCNGTFIFLQLFSLSCSIWVLEAFCIGKSKYYRVTQLSAKRTNEILDLPWFPTPVDDDDIFGASSDGEDNGCIEEASIELLVSLVLSHLNSTIDRQPVEESSEIHNKTLNDATVAVQNVVRGRFLDLACTIEGECILENLFASVNEESTDMDVLRGAVWCLQSVCIFAMQTGVKGNEESRYRRVQHLETASTQKLLNGDLYKWNRESIRRLKFRLDKVPAVQFLAALKWKRAPQGALELLQQLGAYTKHEDLVLLRSGFPVRFETHDLEAVEEAVTSKVDPDALLGLRQNLCHLKVYTIDGASAAEIDDGLSIETLEDNKKAIWVHIADADRWARRDSPLLTTARTRMTSLYLPQTTYPMFPDKLCDQMSLQEGETCALSLRATLNEEDGSLDPASLLITPSMISVTYRLTYDEVDEMLEEGVGYQEEWELGALLEHAKRRRHYRIQQGSSEGFVPNPIPRVVAETQPDTNEPDSIRIDLSVEVSHNAGSNYSATDESSVESVVDVKPVSSASLLVTEAMILAGEALGTWQSELEERSDGADSSALIPNQLRLPFRTQEKPQLRSRARERRVMMDLLEYNVGGGLCHAWYARRFFSPVRITESRLPHFGLGLSSYVQWSSPIRRFSDLQAHAAIKRFLRRREVNQILARGDTVPDAIKSSDLGLPEGTLQRVVSGEEGTVNADELDSDIDFLEGVGFTGVGRGVQKQSQDYWIFEYIRRLQKDDPDKVYTAVVLGCVDPERQQFAIFVQDLAFEHRYTNTGGGRLEQGTHLSLLVDTVSPRHGLLSFVRRM